MKDEKKTKKQLIDELEELRGRKDAFQDITEQKLAEEALRKSEERSDALSQVSNKLAGAHDTDEVLDLIVNEAARLVGADAAFLRLVKDGLYVPGAATATAAALQADSAQATPAFNIDKNLSSVGYVMATKEPLVMEDAANAEQISPVQRSVLQKHNIHGSVGVPLLANDQSIGVLFAVDHRVRRFAADEVSLLSAFADQASLALEKARLLNEAEREQERSDALYQVSNKLAGIHDTDEVLDLIVNEATRMVGAKAAYLRLLVGVGLVPGAATETAASFVAETAAYNPTFDLDDLSNPMSLILATKQPMAVEDAAQDMRIIPEARLAAEKHGFHGIAAVPLLANNRSIGVLIVMDERIRRFTDDEVFLLAAFADQASLALEKARLLNEAEREKERSDALFQVSDLLAGAHDTAEVLDLIVNEAARLLGANAALIHLVDGNVIVPGVATDSAANFVAEVAEAQPLLVVEEGTSLAGHVMATKRPLVTEDITESEVITPEGRRLGQEYGFHGTAAVLLLANDQSIGVLAVLDKRIRRFTDNEVSLLSAFADQASLALEKARLLQEAETREREATQLYEITTQLASSPDMESVLELITGSAVDLLQCEAAGILRYEDQKGGLVPVRHQNMPLDPDGSGDAILATAVIKPGEGVSGQAFEQRRPVWDRDTSVASHLLGYSDDFTRNATTQIGPKGTLAVPVTIRDEVYGCLVIYHFTSHDFTEGEIQLLQTLADSAAVAIGNARFIDETQQARDEATQLQEVTAQLA